MSERGISVTIDENDSGFVAKVSRGGTCKMELPIRSDASPKAISEMLVTKGTHLKYDRGLIRLGDLLMTAADQVPGLTVVDDYQQDVVDNREILEIFSRNIGSISPIGIINANSENNSENNGDNDSAIPEVVRW